MPRLESEQIGATDSCPHPEFWSARDAEASEYEVGDFLYGLVRLIKPDLCIETGCYLGDTSRRIVEALEVNNRGHLFTCDVVEERVDLAYSVCQSPRASFSKIDGVSLIKQHWDIDLAFIDSNGDRVEECKALVSRLSPDAFVVLHDARWKAYQTLASDLGWSEIFFPTPRGISLFKVTNGNS